MRSFSFLKTSYFTLGLRPLLNPPPRWGDRRGRRGTKTVGPTKLVPLPLFLLSPFLITSPSKKGRGTECKGGLGSFGGEGNLKNDNKAADLSNSGLSGFTDAVGG